jgi:hypothetical protein
MGVLKWGVGTAVSVGGVFIITYLLVFIVLLPVMIPVAVVGIVWAMWPSKTYTFTGKYNSSGSGSVNPHRGYRCGGRGYRSYRSK